MTFSTHFHLHGRRSMAENHGVVSFFFSIDFIIAGSSVPGDFGIDRVFRARLRRVRKELLSSFSCFNRNRLSVSTFFPLLRRQLYYRVKENVSRSTSKRLKRKMFLCRVESFVRAVHYFGGISMRIKFRLFVKIQFWLH